MVKEIISLQIGPYCNYVGSHFWNSQELHRHDRSLSKEDSEREEEMMFRETADPMHSNTLIHVPRTIIIDSKNSLSNPVGLIDDVSSQNEASDPNVQVYKQEKTHNNLFLESLSENATSSCNKVTLENIPLQNYHLEKNVRSWSEYVGLKYHPKSLQFIQNDFAALGDKSLSTFTAGCNAFKVEQFLDGFDDSLHYFAEECDSLQGFQMFGDLVDSFGGLTSEALLYIRDEYGKKAVISYATWSGWDTSASVGERYLTMENTFLSLVSLSSNADLVVPLSLAESFGIKDTISGRNFNHLNYDLSNMFQTSGIIASALDVTSLPLTLNKVSLADHCHSIGHMGHKIANIDISLPYYPPRFREVSNQPRFDGDFFQPLLPSLRSTANCDSFTRHSCLRSSYDDVVEVLPKRLRSMDLDHHNGDENQKYHTVTSQLLRTTPPYPQIFTADISENGQYIANGNRSSIVSSAPCSTILSTSKCMYEPLSLISKSASRALNSKACPSQIDREQFDDLNESYSTLLARYAD